ncbi:hypothetical protein QWZ10_09325 [Paracoccus cavernae]|uniref:PepSY domain-containing protein n=1 Tax=Paracoccus cavernae TaxID=1571207 RepID=A0ABT8D5A7_9RHOB|nr:hypothetical protein [Paracoccus cavernae]
MTIRHQLLATLSVAALAISAGTGWSQSENAARAALEAAQAAADAAAEAADAATDDAVAAVEVAVAASGQAQCGPSIAGPWLGASAEESDISSVDEPLQARFLDEENNIFGFRVTDGNQRIRIEARSNADGDPRSRCSTARATRSAAMTIWKIRSIRCSRSMSRRAITVCAWASCAIRSM